MKQRLFFVLIFIILTYAALAQGSLKGIITSSNGPVSYVNIGVLGTEIGTYSNEKGEFNVREVPTGKQVIQCSSVGYKQVEKPIQVKEGQELYLELILEASFGQLEEVVITGTRNETKRTDSPVIVGIISKQSLESVQANSLAEGLNFQAGLRMETDCQTCGYSQLRMNGLGGAYAQILIDGRPIFSSLMALYGLEQIPANIIERIEVVRGGGSAVYGSSAIAGTVNVITKEPSRDYLGIDMNGGVIDGQAFESHLSASVSKSFDKAGITLQASRNERDAYDANGDGFSELPKLEGINFGLNSFYNIGKYGVLGVNFNTIYEYRRGGNQIDKAPHIADQAEEKRNFSGRFRG
jgi:outer membrane receptor for ferrienterochelin and colicins